MSSVPDSWWFSSPLGTSLYDYVFEFANWFAWRCPTRTVLAPFFARYLEHASGLLAIGPGSVLLAAQPGVAPHLSKLKHLALLDPDAGALAASAARVRGLPGYKGPAPATVRQSAISPLAADTHGAFDVVAAFHVLHATPGTLPLKASALAATVLPALARGPDSALVGATVIGPSIPEGGPVAWLSRLAGARWVEIDDADGLRRGLAPYFDEVEVEVVGALALFVARGPKSQHIA